MSLDRRTLLSLTVFAGLGGCSAISAVSRASEPLDTYTLRPLAPTDNRAGGRGHLVVETPTAGGELATERVLIKPSALQAQYLPDARWPDPLPVLVQTLLVNSFVNRGGFRLVSRVGAGLSPDNTLMTEILAFQAERTAPPAPATRVSILMQMTLIRESDRSIAGTRRFGAAGEVASDSAAEIVAGLDTAMQSVLAESVAWARALA